MFLLKNGMFFAPKIFRMLILIPIFLQFFFAKKLNSLGKKIILCKKCKFCANFAKVEHRLSTGKKFTAKSVQKKIPPTGKTFVFFATSQPGCFFQLFYSYCFVFLQKVSEVESKI